MLLKFPNFSSTSSFQAFKPQEALELSSLVEVVVLLQVHFLVSLEHLFFPYQLVLEVAFVLLAQVVAMLASLALAIAIQVVSFWLQLLAAHFALNCRSFRNLFLSSRLNFSFQHLKLIVKIVKSIPRSLSSLTSQTYLHLLLSQINLTNHLTTEFNSYRPLQHCFSLQILIDHWQSLC